MAPVPPNKRDRTGRQLASFAKTTVQEDASDDRFPFHDEFKTNKKDKRQIKHEAFLSKIEKSRSKKLQRRRPSKKLVANLDSLADALPTAGDEEGDDNGTDMSDSPKARNSSQNALAGQINIIKQKSLKHKPGAMKKKEKLDKLERERFSRNLAQMSSVPSANQVPAAGAVDASVQAAAPTSNRWAALRNFISQTMEQNPEFTARENK